MEIKLNDSERLQTSEDNMMCLVPAKTLSTEEEKEMLESLKVS